MNAGRFTKFAFVLAIVALIAGLSACDQIGQLPVPAPPEMEGLSGEIPIGVVVALTGRFADEIGRPMHIAFELARQDINNSGMLGDAKITFITEDDRSESAVEAFIQSYTEKYRMEPNAWAAQSYATLHILAAAMAAAQSTDSTAIRDALANTMDLDTILGQFSFDTVGDAVYDPQILIVKDGEFAVFE